MVGTSSYSPAARGVARKHESPIAETLRNAIGSLSRA
jgi:hypothetical protein